MRIILFKMSLAENFRKLASSKESKEELRTRNCVLNHVKQAAQKGKFETTVTTNFKPHEIAIEKLKDEGFEIGKCDCDIRGNSYIWRFFVSWGGNAE